MRPSFEQLETRDTPTVALDAAGVLQISDVRSVIGRFNATQVWVRQGPVVLGIFAIASVTAINAINVTWLDSTIPVPTTSTGPIAQRWVIGGFSVDDLVQGGAVSGFVAAEAAFVNRGWRPSITYISPNGNGSFYRVQIANHVGYCTFNGVPTALQAGMKGNEFWGVLTGDCFRQGWPGVRPEDVTYGRASITIAWMRGEGQFGQFANTNIPVGYYPGGTPAATAITQIASKGTRVAVAETHLVRTSFSSFYAGYVSPRLQPGGHYAILGVTGNSNLVINDPIRGGVQVINAFEFIASCSLIVLG